MGVFNPPPQILSSPVTSFYQGKAMRAGLAAGEQDAELKDLQIDIAKDELASAPSKREAAKQAALLKAENIQSQIDKRIRDGEIADLELNAKLLTPLLTDYANEKDEDKALDLFNKRIKSVLPNMSKENQQKYMEAAGPDHRFSHEEIMTTGLGVRAFMDKKNPSQHQQHIDALIEAGAISPEQGNEMLKNIELKAGTITGTTEFDPTSDPRTKSQKGAAYQQNVDEYNMSSDVQELITSTLPQVIEMPGAVGIKGAIGTGSAGLLTSMGQEEAAQAFSQYMTGASPAEVAQLQTQLQALRARITPLVTGEGSKRLSEMEREIASKAVGLIEGIKGPADLTKAYPQVMGAMRQLYAESWATKYRLASRDDNLNYPYDLSDKSERIELFTEFSDAGVDINTAKRTIIRLKSIQGVD